MGYRPNPSNDSQTKIENADNCSAAPWNDYFGEGKRLIPAYDLAGANSSPAHCRADGVKQYGYVIASHNDKPAVFLQPGKA